MIALCRNQRVDEFRGSCCGNREMCDMDFECFVWLKGVVDSQGDHFGRESRHFQVRLFQQTLEGCNHQLIDYSIIHKLKLHNNNVNPY